MKKFFSTLPYVVFILCSTLTIKGAATFQKRANGPRIIGGDLANAAQFPFAGAIYVHTNDSQFFCGGTLTANQWVLTAGHCVHNAILFTIQLGSNDLVSDDSNRVTVSSSTYVLHPDFNPETIENDIGLIKLRMEVEYSIYLQPIHPLESELWQDAHVYIPGWGQTSDFDPALTNELRYVYITTITNEECRITYGNQITDNMICAIGNYNEGTCNGDNGGALAVQNGRTYAVVGVASFVSSDGCESTHPSGFTRTAPYYQWITNITSQID
ncbi:hypothetical protein Zmor_015516 [Zophobas morio]|uniref:Peptidase S1 domain-containing protein n=1 Tax=Zophobas morio TaxID=2755281 RepID=A0AA38MHP2_9CUCU|nr:hypothetical protein Zmor_015516 [Zophobas morio]